MKEHPVSEKVKQDIDRKLVELQNEYDREGQEDLGTEVFAVRNQLNPLLREDKFKVRKQD